MGLMRKGDSVFKQVLSSVSRACFLYQPLVFSRIGKGTCSSLGPGVVCTRCITGAQLIDEHITDRLNPAPSVGFSEETGENSLKKKWLNTCKESLRSVGRRFLRLDGLQASPILWSLKF